MTAPPSSFGFAYHGEFVASLVLRFRLYVTSCAHHLEYPEIRIIFTSSSIFQHLRYGPKMRKELMTPEPLADNVDHRAGGLKST